MSFLSFLLFTSFHSAPASFDDAHFLIPNLKYDDLVSIRAAGLESSTLTQQPWSGWYWPLYLGGVAFRYRDPAFPRASNWNEISKYLQTNPALKYHRYRIRFVFLTS